MKFYFQELIITLKDIFCSFVAHKSYPTARNFLYDNKTIMKQKTYLSNLKKYFVPHESKADTSNDPGNNELEIPICQH